jgi:hypothetical protein
VEELMLHLVGKGALVGLGVGALLLGGCATTGQVERAQSTADQALQTAQAAQAGAQRAQQTADAASSTAQQAQATAASAQTQAQSAADQARAASATVQETVRAGERG